MTSTKEKMQQAKELIQAKQYEEARAILRTVDHDKAYEWLDKIDAILGKQKPVAVAEKPVAVKQEESTAKGCLRFFLFGTVGIVLLCALVSYFTEPRNMPPQATRPTRATHLPRATPQPAQPNLDALIENIDRYATNDNIDDVQIVDTRDRGGERGLFISYRSTQGTADSLMNEMIDLFDAAARASARQNMNFDSVVLIVMDINGIEIGYFITDMDDIEDYQQNRITREEFLTRIEAAEL